MCRSGNTITLSTCTSLLDTSTAVLQIHNSGDRDLSSVRIQFVNTPINQQSQHRNESIAPGEGVEVGLLEASWTLEPNETVEISCGAYGSVKFTTFRADDGKVGIHRALW